MNLKNLKSLKDLTKPKMLAPLIIGVLIRFSLAPLTEQRWDMYIWRLHQVFVYQYHVNPFWPQNGIPKVFCCSYPPLWLFTLLLVYPLFALISPTSYPGDVNFLWNPHPWQSPTEMFESYRKFAPPNVPLNLPLLDLIIKAPIIIADILIAILLYKMIKSLSNENNARYAYWAWLLNPFVIWISSVWGMFDLIPTLFVLLSLYYLINKNYGRSALLLGVAVSFKLYPILLIPIFALVVYKEERKVLGVIKYCLVSGGFTLLMIFPTYYMFALVSGQDPLALSTRLTLNLFIKRASPDWKGQNIISGLTPLVALDGIIGKMSEILNFNIPLSPILMTLGLLFILTKIYREKKLSKGYIISYTAVTHFMMYMTYSVVNTPYLTWILPVLLILAAEKNSLSLRYLYWIITLIGIGLLCFIGNRDLSYFISPYFVSEYLKVSVAAESLIAAAAIAILYFAGIKLVLRKS